ncbi:MAG: hypothetical protein NUW01_07085 [Gemmatimonadaceae bacterium]|nr:hypothetical protein [Gemmatimonadaceae bacterium]
MAQDTFKVRTAPAGLTNNSDTLMTVSPHGAGVVLDFLTHSILNGHGFEVRLGVLTTPVTGDVEVTTTAAEMSADSVAGHALIPVRFIFDLEALGGTLPQSSVKMTATASTAGTAFTPLPLLTGGRAAATTARAAAAGGVTVVDDAATTTRLLYAQHQTAMGDLETDVDLWGRGAVNGAGNIYVAVGSVSTGSTYFTALSYLEFTSAQLGI